MLNILNFDKSSSVPISEQLRNEFFSLMENGDLKSGDRIPSEREIATYFQISRQTVRVAITELALLGYFERIVGKGTYVAEKKVNFDLQSLRSLNDMMLDWGLSTSMHILTYSEIKAPSFVKRLLEIQDDEKVLFFERVRLVDGTPFAIYRSYIPLEIAKNLSSDKIFADSLIKTLQNSCGLIVSHSEESLEPTIATVEEAELLNIQKHTPLQLITGLLWDSNKQIIECHKSLFRGDRFTFKFSNHIAPIMNGPGARRSIK